MSTCRILAATRWTRNNSDRWDLADRDEPAGKNLTAIDGEINRCALATAIQRGQQVLYVTTNLGDTVQISAEHPLHVETDPDTQEPSPYVSIGNNLAVLLQRSDFYWLVNAAQERIIDGQKVLGVCSKGEFYPLGAL